MKKYHQLFLLILSVVSISLFLIYRHEYNRLHYVLEVFNFFGQPCNFTDLQDDSFNQNDWGPQPIWQETDDGYVYSAFLIGSTEVQAIALQNKAGKLPRTCSLWYEGNITTIVGKFKSARMSWKHTTTLVPYIYYCTFTNLDMVPFAVSFSSKVKEEKDIPKTLITNNLNSKLTDDIIACVVPSFFNKNMFFEFISFHKMIGINTFIFYDKVIPYHYSKLMKALSHRLEMNTTFLPWNYPKSDNSLKRMLVEHDCLLRTHGHTRYVMTLELDEYVVPSDKISLINSMNTPESNFKKLRLALKSFCVNRSDINMPIALQSYESINNDSFNKAINMFNIASQNEDSTGIFGGLSIHKYIDCNDNHLTTSTDNSVYRYATDFIRTTLVQLLINGQI